MVKPSGQTAADTKTRILDAADAVFVRRGIDGARMQDIADQAGVNKALLHYHFRSKADLARAVWLRIASSFVPGIFQMLGSDISLDEKIERFVDAYHTRLAKHPYLLGYVISEAARHPDFVDDFYSAERRKAARRSLERVEQQINERAKKEKIVPVPADQFLVTLVGSCLYPFVAQPMIAEALGLTPKGLRDFMKRRRTELPALLEKDALTLLISSTEVNDATALVLRRLGVHRRGRGNRDGRHHDDDRHIPYQFRGIALA